MKRRSFLKWIGKGTAAVAAAPVVAKLPAAEAADTIQNQLLDNHQLATHSRGIITTGKHPKVMWPGVEKLWKGQFSKYPTESLQDLFDEL